MGHVRDMQENSSYAMIFDALGRYSSNPDLDRLELWKRMTFNALAGNVDDHLRNMPFWETIRAGGYHRLTI